VEVVSGLSAGEMVIKHGTFKVRPGAIVKIQAIDDGSRSISEMIAPVATGASG
jgi:membrane fusion protein (multidrug efflux system)